MRFPTKTLALKVKSTGESTVFVLAMTCFSAFVQDGDRVDKRIYLYKYEK